MELTCINTFEQGWYNDIILAVIENLKVTAKFGD